MWDGVGAVEGTFHAFGVKAVLPSQLMAECEVGACQFFECAVWGDEWEGLQSCGVEWLRGERVGYICSDICSGQGVASLLQ